MSRKSVAAAAAPLPEVLLLGCEGVGKSCLNGVERDELRFQQTSLIVKEIGGSMKTTWSSYFANATAIMFVLDVSNVFQLADSQFELATLLHNPALRSKPLLLILNKIDAPGALSRSDLQSALRLDELLGSARGGAIDTPSGSVGVVECSAAKAVGIVDVLERMVRMLQPADKEC